MKTHRLLRAFALCVALLSTVAYPSPISSPEPLVPFGAPRRIVVGMTRSQLVAETGEPDAQLDTNVWVYWDFRAVGFARTHPHFDTLLVTFTGQRVTRMKLVEAAPVRAFLARKTGM